MISIPSIKPFAVPSSMSESATFGTKKSTGTFGGLSSAYMTSSTGYFKVEWWDGTSTQYGSGDPNTTYNITKSVVAPYNTSSEKLFTMYPTDSSGKRKGYFIAIYFSSLGNCPVSSSDVTKCRRLNTLTLVGPLTSYTHNPNLQYLTISNSSLTSLSFSKDTVLDGLIFVSNSSATNVNLANCPVLTSVDLSSNSSLTSISNITSCTYLYSFICSGSTGITSLSFSGLMYLVWINVSSCALTSIRAAGCNLYLLSNNTYSSWFGGAWLSANSLNAAALNQFYTDIGPANGIIRVDGNPGTTSDTPTIATGKGYTVLGT